MTKKQTNKDQKEEGDRRVDRNSTARLFSNGQIKREIKRNGEKVSERRRFLRGVKEKRDDNTKWIKKKKKTRGNVKNYMEE